MQPKHFTLQRLMKATAAQQTAEERTVLRVDREALRSSEPRVRFASQA